MHVFTHTHTHTHTHTLRVTFGLQLRPASEMEPRFPTVQPITNRFYSGAARVTGIQNILANVSDKSL